MMQEKTYIVHMQYDDGKTGSIAVREPELNSFLKAFGESQVFWFEAGFAFWTDARKVRTLRILPTEELQKEKIDECEVVS